VNVGEKIAIRILGKNVNNFNVVLTGTGQWLERKKNQRRKEWKRKKAGTFSF
jgi:hypothetical protein